MHKFNRLFLVDIYRKTGYNKRNAKRKSAVVISFRMRLTKTLAFAAKICWGQIFAPPDVFPEHWANHFTQATNRIYKKEIEIRREQD